MRQARLAWGAFKNMMRQAARDPLWAFHDSARLVSDLLGQETVVFQTMSRALDSDKSGISYGEQHTARAAADRR